MRDLVKRLRTFWSGREFLTKDKKIFFRSIWPLKISSPNRYLFDWWPNLNLGFSMIEFLVTIIFWSSFSSCFFAKTKDLRFSSPSISPENGEALIFAHIPQRLRKTKREALSRLVESLQNLPHYLAISPGKKWQPYENCGVIKVELKILSRDVQLKLFSHLRSCGRNFLLNCSTTVGL